MATTTTTMSNNDLTHATVKLKWEDRGRVRVCNFFFLPPAWPASRREAVGVGEGRAGLETPVRSAASAAFCSRRRRGRDNRIRADVGATWGRRRRVAWAAAVELCWRASLASQPAAGGGGCSGRGLPPGLPCPALPCPACPALPCPALPCLALAVPCPARTAARPLAARHRQLTKVPSVQRAVRARPLPRLMWVPAGKPSLREPGDRSGSSVLTGKRRPEAVGPARHNPGTAAAPSPQRGVRAVDRKIMYLVSSKSEAQGLHDRAIWAHPLQSRCLQPPAFPGRRSRCQHPTRGSGCLPTIGPKVQLEPPPPSVWLG
ncbi:uncharacterized protein LOC121143725 [Mesocricetus auratus]|uniref:Uncharacterized protein LOC121143725 n=1 Tax=Mesocricetus auratus TaxID=10036 RepID=A0ABM2YBD1_MESAU|nr:uncharacterized protein LOC121143725 [Mesocricetus auratus]